MGAVNVIIEKYGARTAILLTKKQVIKKISNLKQQLKLKTDRRIFAKPILLNSNEKVLANLLDINSNPTMNKIQGGMEIGIPDSTTYIAISNPNPK